MCSHFMATSSRRNALRSCRFGFLQHRAVRELMKSLAQILEGTVDARSDGVQFAAEKNGNFFILQFLKAAEKQDFSFFPGKPLLSPKCYRLFFPRIPGSRA